MISGIGIAGMLTFPRQILAALTGRRILIAVLAFCAGALPLIAYNVNNHWATFNGNFQRDISAVPRKAAFLIHSASGYGLFGWLTADDIQTLHPHLASGPLEKASARISAIAGHPRGGLLLYGFILALVLAPFAGPKGIRLITFALAAMGVAWIQMAINRDTGGSIHHTSLLWPMPQFVMAVSFSAASARLGRAAIPAVAAIAAILATSGVLVSNEYFAKAVRNGGGPAWNDAILPLAWSIKESPSRWVFSLDWNIGEQIHLLRQGKVLTAPGYDQISKPEMTPDDQAILERMISNPDNLFIGHTPPFEFVPGYPRKLKAFAAARGYRCEIVSEIADSYGRHVFEVYRYTK